VSSKDTIVALSTPPGRSGIGVVRLSGTRVLEVAQSLVQDKSFIPESHRSILRKLYDPSSHEVLDHALITYFKSPHSFTGEDIIEFSCHGSPMILRALIDIILGFDLRLAGPGEFTLRALANGRLNLVQAEAIHDLINAQTRAAAQQATRQMEGEMSALLQPAKNSLLNLIVPLESSLEFVEDDLPEIAFREIKKDLSNLISQIIELSATFSAGRLLREGLKVTLVGRPNVGKSSVFNNLVNSDRAIVTDIPGTTRDSLSETISIQGVPVLLTDTAGLRVSEDIIESLGVERTRRIIADADLVIVVIDGSQLLMSEDLEILNDITNSPHIIAVNKCDLASFKQNELVLGDEKATAIISISAKTGAGLDSLRTAILEPYAAYDTSYTGLFITNARHFDLLQRVTTALRSSLNLLEEKASEELVLVGLYDALRFLGEITGESTPDDILSQIFATFCIGK
jgi:tRNA modification GTPase